MTTEQFADLLTELKAIKLVLITASVLIAASVGMAAFRTYRYVKHFVTERFDDLFRQEGQDLLESGRLEQLISKCRHWLVERPNHTYAHWYLGRAYYLQERWDEALQAFSTAKRISPEWAGTVDPYIDEIREKGTF